MTAETSKPLATNPAELVELLERLRGKIPDADHETLSGLVRVFIELVSALDAKKASIANLRALLFGPKTEKKKKGGTSSRGVKVGRKKNSKKKRKGHGRNGVDAYPEAKRNSVPHETLAPGDTCPECGKGKLYALGPVQEVRVKGQPLLDAQIWELERLRCATCGAVNTAKLPKEAGTKKYDEGASILVSLLKYGLGTPFTRLEKLQAALKVPVPASVQWELVDAAAKVLKSVHRELIRQAAQADIMYNDDTKQKVLSLAPAQDKQTPEEGQTADASKGPKRKATQTTGIVATWEDKKAVLYFTGKQYAGENLRDVLLQRADDRDPPIQMCDALLSQNLPAGLATIVANCLAHGRRKFYGQVDNFPEECTYVLEQLAEVYKFDALAKAQGLSADERLALHQKMSGPIMGRFKKWMHKQINEHLVEPNSGLGKAIQYFKKHWKRLTLFLRIAGAPLDNNICERALKLVVLHRKNAYFYKTERGAAVGDLFMTLIETARLNGVNPYDYLVALQRNAPSIREKPEEWMPWNYKVALSRASPPE